MIPCVANKLSIEYLKEKLDSLRVCKSCQRGFFYGDGCPVHKIKEIKIVEYLRVDLVHFPKKKIKKKKTKSKQCIVCGLDSGKTQCCSDLCKLRHSSGWYENNELKYISADEARIRLDDRINRKKIRELKNVNLEEDKKRMELGEVY